MSGRAPHTIAAAVELPESADANDPRLATKLVAWSGSGADAVLIGAPFSLESARDRAGTAQGPTAIRRRLLRFGTSYDLERRIDFGTLSFHDAGDLEVVEGNAVATASRHAETVASILSTGSVAIVLGGARDVTFGSVQALVESSHDVGGIHVAARFGVEPEPTGSDHAQPVYRRILEKLDVVGSHFVEFALHGSINSRQAHAWLTDRNVRCLTLAAVREQGASRATRSELEYLSGRAEALFVSVELESFAAAYAPGVSYPSSEGLVPEEGRNIAFFAGRHPSVRVFEILGLNPRFDVDGRTAELAIVLLCSFLAGLADRKANARAGR